MKELFTNIPESVKKQAEFVFEMATRQKDITNIVNTLNEYTSTTQNEEEREFVEFYFNMRLEWIKHKMGVDNE